MPIAVFDIDGTLTDTMGVDIECYERAVLEITGVEIPSEWPEFDEVTDPAILARACQLLDRPVPDMETQTSVAERVGQLLEQALIATPKRFSPIPGAREIFATLAGAGWQVAMATGAWRASALVKLRGANIPFAGVPLATSSERPARRDIIQLASGVVGGDARVRPVYVGDGVWDGRAARSLGFGFVGVGSGQRAVALSEVGAAGCVADLSDATRLLSLLNLAAHEL